MKVIICGAGQVGANVARYLSNENISVSIVDPSLESLSELNNIDILTIQGSATYVHTLEAAGISDADVILSVTRSDELNMLICQLAQSLYKTPLKIARVRDHEYLSSKWKSLYNHENIPVDLIISPEKEVANYIAQNLAYTGWFDMFTLFDEEAHSIATICAPNAPLHGVSLKDISLTNTKTPINIIAISRNGKIFLPEDSTVLQAHDILHFIVKKENTHAALSLFGHTHLDSSRLLIVGGGAVGYSLAKHLEHESSDIIVKLVESNKDRAEKIAPKLDRTIVLHGKGLDKNLLLEANIPATDTVVSVTNDENVNLLMSLLAKDLNVQRTISLVNNDMYIPMAPSLKVDALIHPHKITILSILRHIRNQRELKTVHTLPDHSWELMEAIVNDGSEGNGLTTDAIYKLTYGHLVGVWRENNLVFPDKALQLHPNDKAAILIKPQHRRKLDKVFSLSHRVI